MTRSLLFCLPFLFSGISALRKVKDFESQLYEDLLYDYNRIPRPVKNSSDILTVEVGASLIRIIDVDEKNQVLTTNLWLEMQWFDSKLTWNPEKYGNITKLHIPSEFLWTPDLCCITKYVIDAEEHYFVNLVLLEIRILRF
ncbi:unnamed protein product, partial [Mesorhabditis spiculigera]